MRYVLHADALPSPLGVTQLGYSQEDEGTRFGPGQRERYILHYVLRGSGFFNGRPVRAGQGFIITSGQLVEYHGSPEEPWAFLWVISKSPQILGIFDRYRPDPESGIFDFRGSSVLRDTAERLLRENGSLCDPLELEELLLHICNSHFRKQPAARFRPNGEVYLDFCLSYIENNIHKPIRTSDLTSLLGVSQPYLYRLFEERFGISPKGYIINYKMHRAEQLLHDTDLTVSQIAASLGYPDALTFSKAFKAKKHHSPTDFRNMS